jgi:hypothetical protein
VNTKWRVIVVTLVATAFAFGSSQALWPAPAGFNPPASLLPFFVVLGLVESLAFGVGVAFLIFGFPLVARTGVSSLAAWGGYLGIAWFLVNWWAHDGFHRVTGLSFAGLIRIEYAFHVTLIVGAALAAYFFLSVARKANRRTLYLKMRLCVAQRAGMDDRSSSSP